jgi:ABC-type nitrate/sulfonate/bicarbonate transport system substrate-binding protein
VLLTNDLEEDGMIGMSRLERRALAPASILVLAGLLLSACGGGAAPVATKSAAAPTTAPAATSPPAAQATSPAAAPASAPAATAALAKPAAPIEVVNAAVGNNLNHVPSFVGVEKGIFLKHGIDLKLKVLNTGQEMSRAMQAGEASFIGAAVSNTPVSREAGMPVVGITGYMHDATSAKADSPVAIVARSESGIGKDEFEKLVGKKVGLAVGGTGDQYIRVILARQNIPDDKVEFINVQPGNQVSALQTGQVDVISTWEPYGTLLLEKVPGSVLVARNGGYIGYFIMYSTSDEIVKSKPELVERFVTALAESAFYTRQNLDEAAEVSTRWVPGLEVDIARKAIRHMNFDPRISKHSIQNYDDSVQDLLDQKKLKDKISASEAINSTFVEKVMKSHPQFFADLRPIP